MEEIVIRITDTTISVDAPDEIVWSEIEKALKALGYAPDHRSTDNIGGGYHTHHFTI